MSDFNFSFNNPKIKKFFEGDDTDPPISELLYLHEHPLISDNFLNEIRGKALKGTEICLSVSVKVPKNLEEDAIKLGQLIYLLSKENAVETLKVLRSINNYLDSFLKTYDQNS